MNNEFGEVKMVINKFNFKKRYFYPLADQESCKKALKETAQFFYFIAIFCLILSFFPIPALRDLWMYGILYAILGALLQFKQSRVAALVLMILTGVGFIFAFLNELGVINQGRPNIILGLLLFLIAFRAAQASFSYYKLKINAQNQEMRWVATSSKIISFILVPLLIGFFIIKIFFIGQYIIPQNGMYPSLPSGSKVVTLKKPWFSSSSIKYGDIIVFIQERNGRRYNFIWRVIALPGDVINLSGENIIIDGQPIQRQMSRVVGDKKIFREHIGNVSYEVVYDKSLSNSIPEISVTIPPDHFFVMADNRYSLEDSRKYGPVSFSSIIGKKL